jgi:hypothetical protein
MTEKTAGEKWQGKNGREKMAEKKRQGKIPVQNN